MNNQHASKDKVAEAAVHLFNRKGYDGTSVREIAEQAKVNVALISYYFGSKKGLMEYLLSRYLDGYIQCLEEVYEQCNTLSRRECLLKITEAIIYYQQEHEELARFVQREMTLDTVLNREVMTTYLAKENFMLQTILTEGIKQKEMRKVAVPYTIMQLKGMLGMPYLHHHYLREVLHVYPNEQYFLKVYLKEIHRWIEKTLFIQPNTLRVLAPTMESWLPEINISKQG